MTYIHNWHSGVARQLFIKLGFNIKIKLVVVSRRSTFFHFTETLSVYNNTVKLRKGFPLRHSLLDLQQIKQQNRLIKSIMAKGHFYAISKVYSV